jgi:hypothetical protein
VSALIVGALEDAPGEHRQEVQALREGLEQAQGENLDLRRELARRGWTGQVQLS